jgi:hypothetical protein
MSNSIAAPLSQDSTRARGHRVVPATLVILGTLARFISAPGTLAAQTSSATKEGLWALRVSSGAFIPTGSQRNFLKDAQVTAAQLAFVVRPTLAITGTLGWARSRDLTLSETPKLDVFTSDLGLEARPAQWFAHRAMSFRPFVGLGAGARSYNYRKLDVDATNNVAGYVAAGGDVGLGRVGVRLEVRDYATGFKPLVGAGKSDARNDVVIMGALSFNRHRTPKN